MATNPRRGAGGSQAGAPVTHYCADNLVWLVKLPDEVSISLGIQATMTATPLVDPHYLCQCR
jgi:hypothetical protein